MNLQAAELEPWKLWDRSRYQTCIVLGIPLGWDGVLVILTSIRMAGISIWITPPEEFVSRGPKDRVGSDRRAGDVHQCGAACLWDVSSHSLLHSNCVFMHGQC